MELIDNDIFTTQTDWFVMTCRFSQERSTWFLAPNATPVCFGVMDAAGAKLNIDRELRQISQGFWGSEEDPDVYDYKHSSCTVVGGIISTGWRNWFSETYM